MKQITVSKINLKDLEVLNKAGYDVILKQTTLIPANVNLTYIHANDIKDYKNKYKYKMPPHHAAKLSVCNVPHVKGK
jgi:hypothetical protein